MHNLSILNLFGNPSFLPPVLDWCYREWWQEPGSTNGELKEILDRHTQEEGRFTTFVALCDDEPVGSVHFIDKDFETGDYEPCLAGLYVLPGFRTLGLGSMLVDAVVSHAKSVGFPAVYLSTVSAENWYIKLGWRTMETIDAATNNVLMKIATANIESEASV
ncbi:MAG: GNAT family N-acetyltransferase [Halioglobus sp.]